MNAYLKNASSNRAWLRRLGKELPRLIVGDFKIQRKHTGGALAFGIKVYAECRSLIFERSLSWWEITSASNEGRVGPVPSLLFRKSTFDGISNILVTALVLTLLMLSLLRSSSVNSIRESTNSSKNCRSHLSIENNSLSTIAHRARYPTSDGDKSIKREKPNAPLSLTTWSTPLQDGNIDLRIFSGEYILKCFRKDSLDMPRPTEEQNVSEFWSTSWCSSLGIWKRIKDRNPKAGFSQRLEDVFYS